MAKNTNADPVEPTVPSNRNRLRTVGWIAGGVLVLGATFAAGAAIGDRFDGPRGGDFAAGQQSGDGEHGPGKGGHGGDRDKMQGPRGSMPDDTAPAPDVTP